MLVRLERELSEVKEAEEWFEFSFNGLISNRDVRFFL